MFNSSWATGLSSFQDFTHSLQKIKNDFEHNVEASLKDQRQRTAEAPAGDGSQNPPQQGGKMPRRAKLAYKQQCCTTMGNRIRHSSRHDRSPTQAATRTDPKFVQVLMRPVVLVIQRDQQSLQLRLQNR